MQVRKGMGMRSLRGWGVLLWLAAGIGTAQAQVCPADKQGPPTVRVLVQVPETHYVYDKSRVEITAIARERKNTTTTASTHDSSVGLTRAGAYRLKVTASVAYQKRPNGVFCFHIRAVNAVWEIPSMTVFIANNYSPGSCEYRVILDHENQHVAIHQRVLRDFAGQIENELRQAALSISPYVGTEPGDSQKAPKMLVDRARQVMADVDRERMRANGEIDTPEKYRQTRLLCRHW